MKTDASKAYVDGQDNTAESRREMFDRLSSEIQIELQEQGVGEAEALADFEAWRSERRKSRGPVQVSLGARSDEEKQKLLDEAALASSEEGIRQGLAEADQGNTRPAREFFAEFEAANGIRK